MASCADAGDADCTRCLGSNLRPFSITSLAKAAGMARQSLYNGKFRECYEKIYEHVFGIYNSAMQKISARYRQMKNE
ncbi:hypothetical protein ACFQMB_14480 [Pseudobowmanella zhangzhouensis]|uniref:hypothetical protein n=1 Tax=Pseudobowmanella zhangzhouensis TaxID=1537679 RepID=UPI0036171231